MPTILDQIIAQKEKEVQEAKHLTPVRNLERAPHYERVTISMKAHILQDDRSGIIAEIKRKSPSKGVINSNISVAEVGKGYAAAGASGISVLTDYPFFGGQKEDLSEVRKVVEIPVLRKDFIIDEYQVIEAKAIGADLILLIAANLTPTRLSDLAQLAQSLGLEVLMEVHNREELEGYLNPNIDIVGVNNRDLKTFKTSVETSHELTDLIPDEFVKISESGIHDPKTMNALKSAGYHGFLIGENFMKTPDPATACAEFIQNLGSLKSTSD